MKEETTFYSDSHGVRVTTARLIVGEIAFSLANVRSAWKTRVNPKRRGPLGLMGIAIGGVASRSSFRVWQARTCCDSCGRSRSSVVEGSAANVRIAHRGRVWGDNSAKV